MIGILDNVRFDMLSNKNGRIFFWDNLKFLLIILVVIGHAADYYTESSLKMKELYLFIYIFHMPLFIFISGYFSKTVGNKKHFKLEKVFVYLLLYFMLKLCLFISNKYIFCNSDVNFNFFIEDGPPWYLFAMSVWLCIVYIIKNVKPVYVIISSILLGLIVGYDKTIGDFLCISRVIVFFPYFIIGYYLTGLMHFSPIIGYRNARTLN